MATRYRTAFTLVELLVVIAILATLMGLLLPAVLQARNCARIHECASNEEQLGKAVITYEMESRRLPGYANNVGGHAVTWAAMMLPYIGRNDLWEGSNGNNGWRSGVGGTATVSLFVCPLDSPTVNCPLSYVVNVGRGQPPASGQQPPEPADARPPLSPDNGQTGGKTANAYTTQTGLFRNLTLTTAFGQNGNVKPISMTDVRSASRRPMIAESGYGPPAINYSDLTSYMATSRQWTAWDTLSSKKSGSSNLNVTASSFGFLFWPYYGNTLTANPILRQAPKNSAGAIIPIHGHVVNMTFCDGHCEQMSDDAENVVASVQNGVVSPNYDYDDISSYP